MRICHCLPALLAPLALGQELLVPDSTADVVMKFSAVDGSLIDAAFIDLSTTTTPAATPIECIQVGSELWVSDQVADVIFRFDMTGTFLGEYAAGRDNMRGIGMANGSVWVSNSGTGGAGFGDSIKEYLTDGTLNGTHAASDPFDCQDYNGMILVSDISGEDIDMYDYAGTFLGEFHDSDGVTGIDFPEQVAIKGSNGNVLVGGFSTPSGIYEYDPAGNEVAYIDTASLGFGGVRGVAELQDGNLLFTNGSGVHVYDTTAGTVTTVQAASGRFITALSDPGGPIGTNYCGPANLNSSGQSAVISAFGSESAAANNVRLDAAQMSVNEFGYFVNSMTQGFVMPPGSQGNLCVGGSIGRHTANVMGTGSTGEFSLQLNLNQIPTPGGDVAVNAGETWYWQAWFRDNNPNPTNNFTDGICITFN